MILYLKYATLYLQVVFTTNIEGIEHRKGHEMTLKQYINHIIITVVIKTKSFILLSWYKVYQWSSQ